MRSPTKKDMVAYVMRAVPGADRDPRLLLLSYWRIVDGIDIPPETIREIVSRGEKPDTILRRHREILEASRLSCEVSRNGD